VIASGAVFFRSAGFVSPLFFSKRYSYSVGKDQNGALARDIKSGLESL
jgi:hypothetical protein